MNNYKYIISGPPNSGKSVEIARTALDLFRNGKRPLIITNHDRHFYDDFFVRHNATAFERHELLQCFIYVEEFIGNQRFSSFVQGSFNGETILVDDIDSCFEKIIKAKIYAFSFTDDSQTIHLKDNEND